MLPRILARRMGLQCAPASFATVRYATGSVSNRPGSKSFGELRSNAVHEAKDVGGVLAEAIRASPGLIIGDKTDRSTLAADLVSRKVEREAHRHVSGETVTQGRGKALLDP